MYDLFKTRTFTAKFLGALGIVPDLRLLQLANDFRQALVFAIEVKDTP
jgi:hypothetical protein